MNKISNIIVLFCVPAFSAIMLSACQVPIRPDGFAVYEGGSQGYKSVSPERIMYRVHALKNTDNANLDFWKTALKTHMRDSGYIQLSESNISAKSMPGYFLVLAAPVGAKDYTYMIATFIYKDKIVVFESAGETRYFDQYKDNIIKTIENTDIESAARL